MSFFFNNRCLVDVYAKHFNSPLCFYPNSDLSAYFYPEITLWQYVVVLGAAGIASQRIFSGQHTMWLWAIVICVRVSNGQPEVVC
jgi:hypothetical protein